MTSGTNGDFQNHYDYLERISARLAILEAQFRDLLRTDVVVTQATDLARLIGEVFSADEFAELIFSLNIDPDDIEDGTMTVRPHYLVAYCKRRGLLTRLIERCRELRPATKWP